jgi:hypothetical protein
MGGDVERREYLLALGEDIVQHRGLVTYFQLLRGQIIDLAERRSELLTEFEPRVRDAYPNVFYRVDVVDSVHRGIVQAAQSYGLGGFEANTLLLGWPQKAERLDPYAQMMRELVALDKSLLLVDYDWDHGFGNCQLIHIWWGGLRGNGGLMLLVAFLLTAQRRWRDAKVTLITAVDDEQQRLDVERRMRTVIKNARVSAEPRVVLRDNRSISRLMAEESLGVDLAIIGLALPKPDESAVRYFERMNAILRSLPTTILVYSAQNFPGEPLLIQR